MRNKRLCEIKGERATRLPKEDRHPFEKKMKKKKKKIKKKKKKKKKRNKKKKK